MPEKISCHFLAPEPDDYDYRVLEIGDASVLLINNFFGFWKCSEQGSNEPGPAIGTRNPDEGFRTPYKIQKESNDLTPTGQSHQQTALEY